MSTMKKIAGGCRIGFFGLGKSNLSLLCSLPLDNCAVTIRSERAIHKSNIPPHIKIERILQGQSAFLDIDEDILILSPSVRRDRFELCDATARGVILSSDCELFLENNTKSLFAVSGSDGKSTTATLTSLLLNSSQLIGNIGKPMTESLSTECNSYVIELSSFMLTYSNIQAKRACLTNITPNHLDWHKSFEEYRDTKLSLIKNAKECVLNADDEILADYAGKFGAYGIISDKSDFSSLKRYKSEVIVTRCNEGIARNGELIVRYSSILKKEPHNIKNLMMAIAMTDGYTSVEKINEVANSFSGLSHRCEIFLVKDGVEYINSSIDSSPARTVQTLTALDRRVILLLGGRSKGVGYAALRDVVKKYAEYALIFGENRIEIYNEIKEKTKCELYDNITSAAYRAMELSGVCGSILLSPASTSYDAFCDFEERGNRFKNIINEIKCK